MVLLCGVPMSIAVGTSSVMVAATAIMGLIGHAAQGHFEPEYAVPLALIAVLGRLTGGRLAIATNPAKLKKILACTTIAAALFMIVNALSST